MTPAGQPLGVARLVIGSVGLLLRHVAFLFPLAFLPALGLTLLTYGLLGWPAEGIDPAAGAATAGVLVELVVLALNIVVGFVVTGVMCLAGLDAALGKRHTLGDYLQQTLRHGGPVVVLGTLLSIATAFGIVLAVIPGLYIAARWLPWAPAILVACFTALAYLRLREIAEGVGPAEVAATID